MRKLLANSALCTLTGVVVACALTLGVESAQGSRTGTARSCGRGHLCVTMHTDGLRKRPSCVRYRCTVVAADTAGTEILFVTQSYRRGERFPEIVGTYARWHPSGHLSLLGSTPEEESVSIYGFGRNGHDIVGSYPIALAGRYVAFVKAKCPSSPGFPCEERVVRVDVDTGRRAILARPFMVSDLVLTTKGTAAWIEPSDCEPQYGTPALACHAHAVVLERSSTPEVLASSSTIDPHSLALGTGHLYWTEGGQPREATIE